MIKLKERLLGLNLKTKKLLVVATITQKIQFFILATENL